MPMRLFTGGTPYRVSRLVQCKNIKYAIKKFKLCKKCNKKFFYKKILKNIVFLNANINTEYQNFKNYVTAHFLNQLYHSLSREFCIMQCKKIPKSAKLCKCTSLDTLTLVFRAKLFFKI